MKMVTILIIDTNLYGLEMILSMLIWTMIQEK